MVMMYYASLRHPWAKVRPPFVLIHLKDKDIMSIVDDDLISNIGLIWLECGHTVDLFKRCDLLTVSHR